VRLLSRLSYGERRQDLVGDRRQHGGGGYVQLFPQERVLVEVYGQTLRLRAIPIHKRREEHSCDADISTLQQGLGNVRDGAQQQVRYMVADWREILLFFGWYESTLKMSHGKQECGVSMASIFILYLNGRPQEDFNQSLWIAKHIASGGFRKKLRAAIFDCLQMSFEDRSQESYLVAEVVLHDEVVRRARFAGDLA
jgi:hypothetical protein